MYAAAPTVVSHSGHAAAAVPMKGGLLLSPLPYSSAATEGGRRRKSKKAKKSRKATKKALKMLKKMGGDELEAVMGGAEEVAPAPVMEEAEDAPVGARRRRGSRKGGKKSRKGSKKSRRGFLY
jgi:hypothetical protein